MQEGVHEKYVDKKELKHQEMVRERWYIIRNSSSKRYYWDLFVITLALYNSFMTPFEFSFNYIMGKTEHAPLKQIDLVIDVIYVFDIIVGFLTSYIDAFTGDEIFGPIMIAKHYIGQDFLIDFISTFYFEEFFSLPGRINDDWAPE